jgi:multidrug efflux pump subunit AcrA (membrane-fusion protein)
MDPEHFDLREACRRVSHEHLESVTPEDVEQVRRFMTSGDMAAVMFTMGDRYKFGDVLAYSQPRTFSRALQLAASCFSTDEKPLEARRAVRRSKALQCSIFENVDEDLHKECVATLLANGQEISDPTAKKDGVVKGLPNDPRKKMLEMQDAMADHQKKLNESKQQAAMTAEMILQPTAPQGRKKATYW